MALTNFGEAFARNCLRKFYFGAVTPAVANTDYEGEVKALGDRVNVLMFLDDLNLTDYAVGTDMAVQHPTDTEAILHINRQKYWNFDIDTVDKQFTYVDDEDSTLIENAGKVLEKAIDTELLKQVYWVQAGHRVPNEYYVNGTGGVWEYAVGNAATYVTITTAASWGVATLVGARGPSAPTPTLQNSWYPVDIVGRGIRFTSTTGNSPWYRITARTSSVILTFNNWDGSTTMDPVGYTGYSNSYLKGLFTNPGFVWTTTQSGCGCQIEGMASTAVTSTNVYALVCKLAEKLDEEGVPAEDRHLVIPAWFKAYLIQASQLQPDIAMYYSDTVINGKVGRVAGFDLHITSDDRFSTIASPIGALGSEYVQSIGTQILAAHKRFITFAHKWSESRTVDAQAQFAKLYQGLNLYGFKVLDMKRKAGASLLAHKG